MEAWRLIQNNAIETHNKDVNAMIETLKAIALDVTRRANRHFEWIHLGGEAWTYMTPTEKRIHTILLTRIEASE